MRALASVPVALALVAAALTAGHEARAIVVERVVAVVGDRPILLSELRTRARPFLYQVQIKVPAGPQLAAAESQVFKELIEKLIDEELETQAADKAHISVTPDEVDNAFHNIASTHGLSVPDLFKEARAASGLSEQDYRDEIRRQILEGKMLQLRVKGRVRITEEDVHGMYERTLREERRHLEYHPAWIVLRILPGSSPQAALDRDRLAETIADRARRGESFASLARTYSDDTQTRDAGGDLDWRAPHGTKAAETQQRKTTTPEIESALMGLDVGQVAAPMHVGDAVVVMKLLDRQPSHFASYEATKGAMLQSVQNEILDKAKRKWLDELKGRTHIDVRL